MLLCSELVHAYGSWILCFSFCGLSGGGMGWWWVGCVWGGALPWVKNYVAALLPLFNEHNVDDV